MIDNDQLKLTPIIEDLDELRIDSSIRKSRDDFEISKNSRMPLIESIDNDMRVSKLIQRLDSQFQDIKVEKSNTLQNVKAKPLIPEQPPDASNQTNLHSYSLIQQ